jgi:hypothetical protein
MLGKLVPIELGGKTRNLKYGFNALVDLEETFGISIQDFLGVLKTGAKLKDLRTILWVGLLHENEGLTQKQVGDMIDGYQDFVVLGQAIKAAFEATFPPLEKKQKPKLAIPKN